MKQLALLLVAGAGLLAAPATAQHTEFSARASLGLMRFGGPGATANSVVVYNPYPGEEAGYTADPYGSRPGTGFGVAARAQRVGQRQGLLAVESGYDLLRSRTGIEQLVIPNIFGPPATYPATGTAQLYMQSLTVFGAAGRRWQLGKLQLDGLLGPEAGWGIDLFEVGRGTYDQGKPWRTVTQYRYVPLDFRLRLDFTAWYHRVGATASYAHGLVNYALNENRAGQPVYPRILRLGLAYRLP